MKSRSIQCKCFPLATCVNGSSECTSVVGCFHSVQTSNFGSVIFEQYGCLLNNPLSVFTCINSSGIHVTCCFSFNSSDYCNAHFALTERQNNNAFLFSLTIFVALAILLSILALVYFTGRFSKPQKLFFRHSSTYLSESSDSGSGAGKPFLVNRTIARQTTLLECIGKGRFGEVWRAVCNDEVVAVKMFSSRDGASWTRETQIYTTALLSHPNILAYYASDMISRGGCTQLWLVTAYHATGSLHDFLLKTETVTPQCGLKLARSLAAGLAFLHGEVVGFHGKPSIAHRDIKSQNILVMANNEACLADFGLALVKKTKELSIEGAPEEDERYSRTSPPPASPFAGTKRYMAPEILTLYPLIWGSWERDYSQEKPNDERRSVECRRDNLSVPEELAECRHPLLSFEVYQSADVYALGLVMWEIWRRCRNEKYELPYYDAVPADPTFLQMYRVVVMGAPHNSTCDTVTDLPLPLQTCRFCDRILVSRRDAMVEIRRGRHTRNGRRPSLALDEREERGWLGRWASIIAECWNPRFSHRLSALRARKTLATIEATLS